MKKKQNIKKCEHTSTKPKIHIYIDGNMFVRVCESCGIKIYKI